MQRDAVRAIDVLHVGAHFDDVHLAIAIERVRHRLLDERITQNELQRVAIQQLDRLQFLLRSLGLNGEGVGGVRFGECGAGESEEEKQSEGH